MKVDARAPTGRSGGRARVLVVEDAAPMREVEVHALTEDGFDTVEARDGSAALSVIRSEVVDAVILDLGLPLLSGLDLLAEVRETSDVPVIIVTGRGDEGDRLQGLGLGADDYVVKPFSPRELSARVRSLLRRSTSATVDRQLVHGRLCIDPAAREVRRDGDVVELTPRELDLLVFLASSPRRAFSRSELLRVVWGSSAEWQTPATVTEHVRRLRHKLEYDPLHPRWVVTVRRIGYRFDP